MGVFAMVDAGDLKYPPDDVATRQIKSLDSVPFSEPISLHLRKWSNAINFLNYYRVVSTDSESLSFFSCASRPKRSSS